MALNFKRHRDKQLMGSMLYLCVGLLAFKLVVAFMVLSVLMQLLPNLWLYLAGAFILKILLVPAIALLLLTINHRRLRRTNNEARNNE